MKKPSRRTRRRPNRQQTEKKEQQPFFSQTKDSTVQAKEEAPFFQTKLTIGEPGDKYEQEADDMADAVVNRGTDAKSIQQKKSNQIQRVTLATPEKDERLGTAEQRMEEDKMIQEKPEEDLQMKTAEEEPIQMMTEEEEPVQKMEEEEPIQMMHEEEEVQTKSESTTPSTASHQLSAKVQQRKGRGRPLPENTQTEMENAFGVNFSEVNIHTDADAVQLNKELGAQAFTNGKDVYFNTGKYRPETNAGKHLLAHELTHVVQQGASKQLVQKKNGMGNKKPKKKFDKDKMLEIARRSPTVRKLEVEVFDKLGFKYGRPISKENSITYCGKKKIHIEKELSNEQAALDYAYELQNAVNCSRYDKISKDAKQKRYASAEEYATDVLKVEVLAVINEATVAMELGMETEAEIKGLVMKRNKGDISQVELETEVLKWIEEEGDIGGVSAREHYEQMFEDSGYRTSD